MGFTRDDLKRVLWTFIQAGAAAAIVVISAQSEVPKDWDTAKQVGIAVVLAAIAAGISAVKNFFLSDGAALK